MGCSYTGSSLYVVFISVETFRVSFTNCRYNGTFTIDNEGNIRITRRLDREIEPQFQFILVAHDKGIPLLSSTASVEVTVLDINDNQPKFKNDRLLVEIPEELHQSVFLLKVEVNIKILVFFVKP